MARFPWWKRWPLSFVLGLVLFPSGSILLCAFLGDLMADAVGFKTILGVLAGAAFGYAFHRWVVFPAVVSRLTRLAERRSQRPAQDVTP